MEETTDCFAVLALPRNFAVGSDVMARDDFGAEHPEWMVPTSIAGSADHELAAVTVF